MMEATITEAAAPLYNTEDGKANPAFDERRGEHLLSPGDLVRYGAAFWEVTGVFLSTEHVRSTISMRSLTPGDPVEHTLPLVLLDGCHVYLLADRRPRP